VGLSKLVFHISKESFQDSTSLPVARVTGRLQPATEEWNISSICSATASVQHGRSLLLSQFNGLQAVPYKLSLLATVCCRMARHCCHQQQLVAQP
jgi:hypothetical protein